MKKNIFTLLGGIAILFLFLNSSSGYGSVNDEGITGAPGDEMNGANPKTCQYCHSSGAFGPPTMTIQFLDSTATNAVTSYLPNKLYTIRVTITAGSGTPTGYGFQMIDIRKSNSTNLKGFLPTTQQNTGIQITTLMKNARQYAEHNRRSTSNRFDVKWRAPATSGFGIVAFYAAGNAVNGNGDLTGDGTTFKNAELPEGRVSTRDIGENIHFNLSSNLITEGVTLNLLSSYARLLQVRMTDLSGSTVLLDSWQVMSGDNQKSLDLSTVNKGVYMIQIIDNQSIVTKKIIKI
jgi:Secretion system C-terminal sorting domain